jgi:hypothetical protein
MKHHISQSLKQPTAYTNRVIYPLFCDTVLRGTIFTMTFSFCLKLLQSTDELTSVSSRTQSVLPRNWVGLCHEIVYIYAIYANVYFCLFKISTVGSMKRQASFRRASNCTWSDSQQKRRFGPLEFFLHSDAKMWRNGRPRLIYSSYIQNHNHITKYCHITCSNNSKPLFKSLWSLNISKPRHIKVYNHATI